MRWVCVTRIGVDEEDWVGLYKSCGNRGSVGRVSVGCGGVGGLEQGLEGWCYVCVSCKSRFFV